MKEYSYYGFNEFVICCGYRQHIIKEWFADYYLLTSDATFEFTAENRLTVYNDVSEPWKVTLVDMGLQTMTGGRVKRVHKYAGTERFMLTYSDGVSDVNIKELLEFHKLQCGIGTLTFVNVGQRFVILGTEADTSGSLYRFYSQLVWLFDDVWARDRV